MKNKASLLLMELLAMVLIFAWASAGCLQLFAKADQLSQQIRRREEAVTLAQNAAEILKSGADTAQLDTGEYTLQILPENSGTPGLCVAQIIICYEAEPVFSLRTGWQEVP